MSDSANAAVSIAQVEQLQVLLDQGSGLANQNLVNLNGILVRSYFSRHFINAKSLFSACAVAFLGHLVARYVQRAQYRAK